MGRVLTELTVKMVCDQGWAVLIQVQVCEAVAKNLDPIEDLNPLSPCELDLPCIDLQKEATVREFLEVLALCHTVEVTGEVDGRMVYNAASPDEKALVEACHNYGVNFK